MKIAVISRPRDPLSLLIYQENLTRELSKLGVNIIPISERESVPSICDLLWDPALAMRRPPRLLVRCSTPVMATMHGVKSFSLPAAEVADLWIERCYLALLKRALISDWQRLRAGLLSLVAVSEYGAEEVIRAFHLPPQLVHVIYHGVDHNLFHPDGEVQRRPAPYFIHVSGPNPIKNVPRLFAAYESLPAACRPELVAVIPGYSGRAPRGVQLIRKFVPQGDLAALYRGAIALIFPSLRETFGMPILEAMACGCPVMTSDVSACPEVAGDAALLVNPRSTDRLAHGMKLIAEDELLRGKLRDQGLLRAQQFSWRHTAERFLTVARLAAAGTNS